MSADSPVPAPADGTHTEAAKRAACDAEAHKTKAEHAAEAAINAKTAAEAIRKRLERAICFQIIQSVVSIATLGFLAYQGFIIKDQLNVTEQQLRVASYTEELAIEQRIRDGTQAIQKLVYDQNGVFAHAQELSCSPMPDNVDTPATEAEYKTIVSHYELYHKAARLGLIPRERWRSICQNAKALFEQNCLLQKKLDQESDLDPDFRAAFIPSCNF